MYTKIHFSCAHTNSNLWSDMNHVTELHYIIVKEKQFLSLWKSICKDSSLSFCHSSLVILIGVSDEIWLPVWELSCDWVTRQEFSVLTVQTLWGWGGHYKLGKLLINKFSHWVFFSVYLNQGKKLAVQLTNSTQKIVRIQEDGFQYYISFSYFAFLLRSSSDSYNFWKCINVIHFFQKKSNLSLLTVG